MAETSSRPVRGLPVLVLVGILLSAVPTPATFHLHIAATSQVLVLQPDGVNGTDTFIRSGFPLWNYGDNASLYVGPNATSGDVARGLLSFDVGGFPQNAVILNATLGLYAAQGGGNVQAHQVLSAWTEGTGGHSWAAMPVTVRETAGVNRTLEPVSVTIPFLSNSVADPTSDLRLYSGGTEVPSQVYRETSAGGRLVSADLYFDVTVGAYQTRTYTVVYSTNETTVPSYRTQGFSTGPVWTSMATGGGASGATIADIDGDGKLEIVFGGADGYVYCLNNQGGLLWRTLVSLSSPVQSVQYTPQVADVDHSGRDSIFAVTNDPSVVRLNSRGAVVWRYNASAVLYSGGALVDVNGDGIPDFVVGGNMKQVIALNGATGMPLPTSYAVGGAGYWPTIADLDGSGTPEILFDGYDKNVHAYALDGTELWATAPTGVSVFENGVGYGDLYGNGAYQVVTGDFGNNGDAFAVYASNHSIAWSTIAGKGWVSGLALGDLNGDGRLEPVMGDLAGSMYAFQPNGQFFWPSAYSAGVSPPGSPALVDLTKSGYPNVVFLEGTSIVVLTRNGNLGRHWTLPANNQNVRGNQFPMTNPAIADLTGNGTLDIVVPTGTGMQAFSTGGLDHDWRTWGYNLNHTQRFLDGTSGTGAPLLQTAVGTTQVYPAIGVSWNYEDGRNAWSLPGGDIGPAVATAPGASGWMAWNVTELVQGWVSGTYPNRGLALTESSEVTGALHTFVSSDSPTAGLRPILTVTYISIAGTTPPRIVGTIPDVLLRENDPPMALDLEAFANDTSTALSELRWNVTGFDTSVVQVTGLNVLGNSVLTVIPQPDRSGSNQVTYWLSDPQGGYARQNAWINVTPVNQPPLFAPPAVLYVRYNQTYTFDFGPYISDPDTPRGSLTLSSDDRVHAPVSGFNVSFTYPVSFLNRWVFVNLTVSDGESSVTRVEAIQVTSDYPPIVTTPLPDLTLNQGEIRRDVFNLGDPFADPNHDALYFSPGTTHVNVTIQANLSVDVTAPTDWWGQEQVTFLAQDPTGALAEDTIVVTVLHADQPPAIGPIPNLRVRYDVPYSFNLDPYLSDPDTPLSQLYVNVSDPHVFVSGHLLTLLYPATYNNTLQAVAVSVSDGVYTASRGVLVAVGADWPPDLVLKMPDTSFREGTVLRDAYNLSRYFADPDGSTLFWSSGNRSILVTIHANGSVDLAAVPQFHGSERVTFRATDAQGALEEDTVWITVTPVDNPPFFLPVPDQLLNRTTTYLPLTPYLRDPDTNPKSLVLLETNSSHAVIIGQGILLTYTGDTVERIRVVVSDGNLTNATTIRVVVLLAGPGTTVTEILPGWLAPVAVAIGVAALVGFVVYRRRQLEWAFLVTNDGLLVSSISRRGPGDIDTDLVTGMLTTIMDFAKKSFSDEKERNLEGLELGEKRVAITRGDRAFLAVVYRGRTPGRLVAIMRSLLEKIEATHRDALGEIVDMDKLGDIPLLLQRLVTRGNLPFVSFREAESVSA